MKINPSAGFNKYQTYVSSLKNTDKAGAKVSADSSRAQGENTDKVSLSENALARVEASRAAAAEVESLGSAARISELKAQVEAGEYYVSTDKLADAILGGVSDK